MFSEQAAGHLETAVTGYKSILISSEESKVDPHIRDFLADQLIWCLYNAQQWLELRDFLLKEESRTIQRATIPLLSISSAQMNDIIEFSNSDNNAIIELSDWKTLDSPTNASNNFSYNRVISITENTICKLCLLPSNENNNLKEKCIAVVHSGLQECLRTRSKEHLNNLTILNYICNKLLERTQSVGEYRNSFGVDKCFGSITLMHLLNWSNYFDPKSAANIDLLLDVCSMSRKENNLSYCRQQLQIFFNKMRILDVLNCDSDGNIATTTDKLELICSHMTNNDLSSAGIWNSHMVRGVYETSKWMYCVPDKKESAIQFTSANTISIQNYLRENNDSNELKLVQQSVARSLLKLSEWIQPESEKILTLNSAVPLVRLVNSLDDIRLRNGQPYDTPGIKSISSSVDLAVGKLISSSIKQCPEWAKSWGAYGNWCYRWGRKLVELRAETDGLRNIDIANITALIPTASSNDIDCVAAVLNQHKLSAEDEESIISNSEEMSSTELIESQLKMIPILSEYSSEQLQQIVEIWRQAHKSVYSYYEMAAEAYFKYLQLTTLTVEEGIDVASSQFSDKNSSSEDCSTVTATLRILRLIVKHALGLQDVLEDGLASTPSTPWKVCFPFLTI